MVITFKRDIVLNVTGGLRMVFKCSDQPLSAGNSKYEKL